MRRLYLFITFSLILFGSGNANCQITSELYIYNSLLDSIYTIDYLHGKINPKFDRYCHTDSAIAKIFSKTEIDTSQLLIGVQKKILALDLKYKRTVLLRNLVNELSFRSFIIESKKRLDEREYNSDS